MWGHPTPGRSWFIIMIQDHPDQNRKIWKYLVQRLCAEKSENISPRDYVRKKMKHILWVPSYFLGTDTHTTRLYTSQPSAGSKKKRKNTRITTWGRNMWLRYPDVTLWPFLGVPQFLLWGFFSSFVAWGYPQRQCSPSNTTIVTHIFFSPTIIYTITHRKN